MLTIQNIFSNVQNDISDLAMEKLHIGEYIDFANAVGRETAINTEIWIARYITTPNPAISAWSATTTYSIGSIVINGALYYKSAVNSNLNNEPPSASHWTLLSEFSLTTTYNIGDVVIYSNQAYSSLRDNMIGYYPYEDGYWVVYLNEIGNMPNKVIIPYTDANGNILAPYRFLRVVRNTIETNNSEWYEAREYSIQTISATAIGNNSFPQNLYQLDGRAFATDFVNPITGTVDDSRVLTFAKGFEYNEQVCIDFIQSQPFLMVNWTTPSATIPGFLEDVFYYGVLWKACERLYNRGDEKYGERANRAKKYYHGSDGEILIGGVLRCAMDHAQMLKDKNSTIQTYPHIYLPE